MAALQVPESTKQPVNFLRGCPSPDFLPGSLLSAACQRVLAKTDDYEVILNYGQTEGYEPLRQQLAVWLGEHYGTQPSPERLCITGGASQSLACVLQSFTDPAYTRSVWMVAPCYFLAAGIFEDSGFAGRLKAIPEDEEGIDLQMLQSKLEDCDSNWNTSQSQIKPFKSPGSARKLYRHVIYAVPTCSNPSGKTMTTQRREALVKLARKHDALIVCDDVYDLLQWQLDGPISSQRPMEMRLPRLSDIDRLLGQAENDPQGFGHAISNGSFSKIAGPGVRTGWVDATPAFALGLSRTGSTMSGGTPSQLCAAMLAESLREGELQNYLDNKIRPALKQRHRLMTEAIQRYLAPLGVETPGNSVNSIYGGYFIWITLPLGQSANMIAERAMKEENIIVGHGNIFAVRGDEQSADFDRNIRLCYSWVPEEAIGDGIKRLGDVIQTTK